MGFRLCFGVLVKVKVNAKVKFTIEEALKFHLRGEDELYSFNLGAR